VSKTLFIFGSYHHMMPAIAILSAQSADSDKVRGSHLLNDFQLGAFSLLCRYSVDNCPDGTGSASAFSYYLTNVAFRHTQFKNSYLAATNLGDS
jgi:hypothetical protein